MAIGASPGQAFVVENKPGAGSNLAIETVAKAPPDGYTLGVVATIKPINTTLYNSLVFDFCKDITPVESLVSTPQVMEVNPSVPARDGARIHRLRESQIRAKINMASGGVHGAMTRNARRRAVRNDGRALKLLHVTYHGSPPALTDLLSGQMQVMFDTLPTSIALIEAGQLRPLAVTAKTSLDLLCQGYRQ